MWRVERLYLKNFIHIYSGMGKYEIDLKMPNDKKINIFIGKMGSGKSAILGHLQPFASYGSLDARNQDKLIIAEEDGIKNIIFTNEGKTYDVLHKYLWNKNTKTHNVKSYIKINDLEMNENGNAGSFKEIIKSEFGLDQSFLRLLRLGPNVANLINMKSTERKSFVASLINDTKVYTTIYTKLADENRGLVGAMKLMSNKLVDLSSDKLSEMEDRKESIETDLTRITDNLSKVRNHSAQLDGSNRTLLNGANYQDLVNIIEKCKDDKSNLLYLIKQFEDRINKVDSEDTVENLNILYGATLSKIDSNNIQYQLQSAKLSSIISDFDNISEKILLSKNDEQLATVEERYRAIEDEYNKLKKASVSYNYPYNYNFLVSFINTINEFQNLFDYILDFDKSDIMKVYKSDKSILSWAKKKLNILTGAKVNTLKKIASYKFADTYVSTRPLYFPPLCPTHDCPFYQTHPETIKLKNNGVHKETQLTELINSVDTLDKEIAVLESYGELYSKMQYLKKMWKDVSLVLYTIGAIENTDLYKMLTNLYDRLNWYDYSRLIDVTELAKNKEDFIKVENIYYQTKNEMLLLKNTEIDDMIKEKDRLGDEKEKLLLELNSINNTLVELRESKVDIENRINLVSDKENNLQLLNNTLADVDKLDDKIKEYVTLINLVDLNKREILADAEEILELEKAWNSLQAQLSSLTTTIYDIKSTSSSYDEYMEKQRINKLIMDAVSTKDGIPLILVKGFLDECREIVNELIYDIFEDSLEILDFQISEENNEFKIPFMSNGIYVDDIMSASQGQQSIISIALSFAICRKSTFDYNIILLDEIDNSIYKHDREKFINILFKQMTALNTSQVFLITHNDIFQQSGLPLNIIMTTDENVDTDKNKTFIKL